MKVVITENQLKSIIQEKKKSKKKDEKPDFDRVSFYLDFYQNLTPPDFDICKKGDEIIITIPKK